MKTNDRLKVRMYLGDQVVDVGELVADQRKIYFRFDAEFVDRGLQLSPFKLPLTREIVAAEAVPFDGLFGVFSDSLPDGWGRLLLDRTLSAKGIASETITPLDRLAFVGKNGMGALIYEPALEEGVHTHALQDLDYLSDEMQIVLEGAASDIMDELYELGGSSGGARPKIAVGYNPETDQIIPGGATLPEGYEHWLIKFPAAIDRPDVAHIEYAYYKMALSAGLEMSESRLFKGQSGRSYFGTKRFDRIGNQRLHMHSASGLLHDNFRLSNLDYGHLMDAAFRLERHVHSYEKILRLAAFNVFSHNRDDHSKNFAFLMEPDGSWRFAPAYDLTFSASSHGFHSTMVAGESRDPGTKNLLELAEHFRIKHPESILDPVRETIARWLDFAKDAGVSRESQEVVRGSIGRIK